MNINITKASILRTRYGCDRVYLETDLPPAMPYDKNLDLVFEVPRGKAEKVVPKLFPGVPWELRDVSRNDEPVRIG